MFNSWDSNRDGEIDRRELKAGLVSLGANITEQTVDDMCSTRVVAATIVVAMTMSLTWLSDSLRQNTNVDDIVLNDNENGIVMLLCGK